jgi:hypothetical protein
MLCAGLLLKDDPVGLPCASFGFVFTIGGPLLFVIGTVLRVWK